MTTVTLNGAALDAAHTELETVAKNIETARANILKAIPDRVSTPSLDTGGKTTFVPVWLRSQKTDPIGMVRDLAHLLDEGDGTVSVTTTSADTMEGLETELGRLIAEKYKDVPPDDDKAYKKWATYLTHYGDVPAVMKGINDTLNVKDTVSVITRADATGTDITGFAKAAAEEAGGQLKTAITEPVSSSDQTDVQDSTAVLTALNGSIADGGKLTKNGAAFIETWLNTVGADNLASLPTTLDDMLPPGMPGQDGVNQVKSLMNPIADSILNYSNPAVHAADAGIDVTPPPHIVPNGRPDGIITLSEMPQAIQELTAIRIGVEGEPGQRLGIPPTVVEYDKPRGQGTATRSVTGIDQFSDIQGLDQLDGWGRLLDSSTPDVEGGEGFSTALADQALTARRDLNAIEETASSFRVGATYGRNGNPGTPLDIDDDFSDIGMSRLLGVASRNEDAASTIVLDDNDRHTLLMSDWDIPLGAQDLIGAGTDRDPADGGGTRRQANAALALMDDIAEDPERWQAIMPDAMKDSVVDVGLTWVDTFGLEDSPDASTEVLTGDDARDALGRPLNFQLSLDGADRRQFMEFIAGTGDENASVFRAGMMNYGNTQLQEAYATGDDDAVQNALAWSGRSDARMDYAVIDSELDETEEKHAYEVAEIEKYNEKIAKQKAAASMIFDLASGSFGEALGMATTGDAPDPNNPSSNSGKIYFPKPGPFLITTGIGLAKDPILDAIFQSKDVPDFSREEYEARLNGYQELQTERPTARTYDQAQLLAGNDSQYAGRYPHLYDDHGQLKPLSQIKGTGLDDLRNIVDGVFTETWTGEHPVDYQGSYVQQINEVVDERDNDLPAWKDKDDEVIEAVRENATDGRRRLWDPDALQQALYGDNQDRYDDRPRSQPIGGRRPTRPAGPDYGPYDYEPTEVGVDSQ